MAANKFATLLHRKTNKITLILIYALLEWILIFFLLLNSLFFYLILKFADYFGLKRPCLLCSRVDHLFDPANDKNSYRDLICDAHAGEISKLGFCSTHRKLAESHDMCEDCSPSSKPELSQKFAYFPWMKQIGMIRDDEMVVERSEADSVKCSCCEVKMEKEIYSPYLLLKPSWGVLDYTEGENLIKEDTRLIDAVVDEDKGNHSDPDSAPENPKDEEMVEETRGIDIVKDVEGGIEGKEVEEFSGFLSSFDCHETKNLKADLITVEEEEGLKNGDTNESQNSNKGKFLEIPPDHIEFYFDQDDCHLIPIELMDSTTLNTVNGDVVLDFDVHMRREKLDVVVESRHSFEETVELLTANESKKERMAAILLESSGFDLNEKESSSIRRDDDLIENGFGRDGIAQAKRDVEIIAAAIGEESMETEDQEENVQTVTALIEQEHTETEDQVEIVEAISETIEKEDEETENCQGDEEAIAAAVGKEGTETEDELENVETMAAALAKEDIQTKDHQGDLQLETIAAEIGKEETNKEDQQGNVETILAAIDEDDMQAENHEGDIESMAEAIGEDHTHTEDHQGDIETFEGAINNGDNETEGDDVKTIAAAIGNEDTQTEDHQGDATTINNVDMEKKDDVEIIAEAIGNEDMETEDLQGDLKTIAAEIGEDNMGLDDHEAQAYDDVVHDEVESDETDADISIGTEIPDHEPIEIDDNQNEECTYTTYSSELLEQDDHGSEQGEELLEFKVTPIETNEKMIQIASDLQEIEEDKVPDTPTSIDSFHQLHKRLLQLERKESGTEDSLDSNSVVSDIDGSDAVVTTEKLKSALKDERKALNALYSELEEERSASSIAASQTMAMINRLQEEKATMQMEALQYQRMMEEQSEYDLEALQLMNDLMVKREKEKAELEKELDICRKKLHEYEAKEHMLRLRTRKDRSVSRTSSASCSVDAEDVDGLNVDLNQGLKEEDGFCNFQETDQNTPVDTVVCLEDSFSTFEDERLSILEQLKVLESKLLTLSDDEDQCFEDIKPFPNEGNGNKQIENFDFSPEENGHSKSTNGEHNQERRIMTQKAKRLLPLFDAAEVETEDGQLNGNGNGNGNHYEQGLDSVSSPNSSNAKFEMENKRAAIEEEVDHVYERLQALEADREFLKHCLNSLRKGDKGIYLLQEILQHLRDLKGVEHRVKNMGITTAL